MARPPIPRGDELELLKYGLSGPPNPGGRMKAVRKRIYARAPLSPGRVDEDCVRAWIRSRERGHGDGWLGITYLANDTHYLLPSLYSYTHTEKVEETVTRQKYNALKDEMEEETFTVMKNRPTGRVWHSSHPSGSVPYHSLADVNAAYGEEHQRLVIEQNVRQVSGGVGPSALGAGSGVQHLNLLTKLGLNQYQDYVVGWSVLADPSAGPDEEIRIRFSSGRNTGSFTNTWHGDEPVPADQRDQDDERWVPQSFRRWITNDLCRELNLGFMSFDHGVSHHGKGRIDHTVRSGGRPLKSSCNMRNGDGKVIRKLKKHQIVFPFAENLRMIQTGRFFKSYYKYRRVRVNINDQWVIGYVRSSNF